MVGTGKVVMNIETKGGCSQANSQTLLSAKNY